MREFTVTMPFAGAMTLTVQAENEEHAKEKFYEKIEETVPFNWKELDKIGCEVEWGFHEEMVRGNIISFQYNEVEIQDNGEIE